MRSVNEKIESTKYQRFFRKTARDSLKEISNVSSIQRSLRGSGQKHMHSALYKGYSCIKSMLKMQQNSKWCQPATSVLLEILFTTIQRYATYFFFYCTFSPSMFSCLYFPCFRDPVFPPLFSFFVIITPFVCFKSLFCPALFAFQLYCMKMEKTKSQVITKTESRTRDRNGTCVFGSINVLYRNRCWKTEKKREKLFCYLVEKFKLTNKVFEKRESNI